MISWIGGKSRMSSWISGYVPDDIVTYVEPFGGGFWVFMKSNIYKYPDLTDVVYNDYNRYLVNLFACVKDYDRFYEYLGKVKSQNRDLFYRFQHNLFHVLDHKNIDIPSFGLALEFAYIVTQVWSGTNPERGRFIDLRGKYKSKFDTFRDKLVNDYYRKRIDKINHIENLDFEECIVKYDSDKSFYYIDAPYYNTEHYYSNNEFGIKDHFRLSNVLKSIKGKFAMSYYYFDDLEKWFPKDRYVWIEKDFAKAAAAKKGKTQTKGTELLIMNYEK